jgi:parallel beta-helix repeat protein
MKYKYFFITSALGLSLTMALLWVLGAQNTSAVAGEYARGPNAPANELLVCPSGPPNCQYTSIQAAVDAANPGDVIKIATGVYTDVHSRPAPPGYPYPYGAPTDVVTQVVYISKTISMRGGYTAPDFAEPPNPEHNPTTLDAQQQGHVIFVTGDITSTIEGLHLTGGGTDGHICMGLEPGGGVYVGSTAATIHDNRVFGNRGGGLFVQGSDAIVSGNIVAENEACDGGGLMVQDSVITISGNHFSNNDTTAFGGGISLESSDAMLVNNVILGNRADFGGGVWSHESNAMLINNAVLMNHVYSVYAGGGGLFFWGGSSRLLHNTIANNTGGDGSGVRVDNLNGGGIYSTVYLSNTILVSHTVGITVTGGHTVTVDGILWHSTTVTISQSTTATVSVQNQHAGDPGFAVDGYHITAGSAAIDKGVDMGVILDIDDEPRPVGPGYDLGADEFWYRVYRIYLPLLLRDN